MSEPGPSRDDAVADQSGLVVPSAPRSVALVRRYAVDACTALGWADSADTVALLVSEVTTDAVMHSYGTHIRVRVLDRGLRLRLEVVDGSPALPFLRGVRPGGEDGRGLPLVEALAIAWSDDARPDGRTTWFELGI